MLLKIIHLGLALHFVICEAWFVIIGLFSILLGAYRDWRPNLACKHVGVVLLADGFSPLLHFNLFIRNIAIVCYSLWPRGLRANDRFTADDLCVYCHAGVLLPRLVSGYHIIFLYFSLLTVSPT